MKVVVDTNVLISGLFFGGVPGRILDAWRQGRLELVVSPTILEEYREVAARLAADHPGVSVGRFLRLVADHATLVEAPPLPRPVSADPDDDKFLACGVAAECEVVVSGDRHLTNVEQHRGVRVMTPREFADEAL